MNPIETLKNLSNLKLQTYGTKKLVCQEMIFWYRQELSIIGFTMYKVVHYKFV